MDFEEATQTIFTPENDGQVLKIENFDEFLHLFSQMYVSSMPSLNSEHDRDHFQNPLISSSVNAKA
jgi:hypothetical protein